ncbi:MAG TPA: hypothetical protein VGE98_10950 [Thermoanaerobaculia bacterium]
MRQPSVPILLPCLLALLLILLPSVQAAAGRPKAGHGKPAAGGEGGAASAQPAASPNGTKKLAKSAKAMAGTPLAPAPTAPEIAPPVLAGGSAADALPASRGAGQTLADYIRNRRAAEAGARERIAAAVWKPATEAKLTLWHPAYRQAAAPLHAALDEALRTLAIGWGPYARNVGFAVQVTVGRLRRSGLLPAPDPLVDGDLVRALGELETGADACQRGMPTTAQLHLLAGRRWLARAEARLPPPNGPAPCPTEKARSHPREVLSPPCGTHEG